MRMAMAEAKVGDHTLGDDPTAAELEQYVAELLGKEAALFFPSGIMANQTAILVQARPGTDVVLDAGAHIVQYEEGGAAALAGAQVRVIGSDGGIPDVARYAAAIRRPSRYQPECSLVCLENTHNSGGGKVLPYEVMSAISTEARAAGLGVHLDGARLPNVETATGRPMRDWAGLVDTVMVSLSKGLGAPVGSMLAGSSRLMERAWRVRRRLGGGMRQAGILAAAGLHALRYNFPGLADDHRRAARLAAELALLPGISAPQPDTNIVMFDIDPSFGSALDFVAALDREGVRMVPFGPQRVRAVLHRDVDDAGVETAIAVMKRVARRGV